MPKIENNIKYIAAGSLALIIFFLVTSVLSSIVPVRWLSTALVVPLLFIFLSFHLDGNVPPYVSSIRTALIGFALVWMGWTLFQVMQSNVTEVPQWDFHFFWAYGRVAVAGLNPYEHAALLSVLAPISPSPELQAELFFFYPPPSLFMFLPLSWFDINQAYAVWYIINLCFLGGALYLLWKLFSPHHNRIYLLFFIALLLLFRPLAMTIEYGQTHFMLLFFILMFWHQRQHWMGGVWLALAVLVKPIALILLLYVVLQKKWHIIVSMIGAFVVLFVLAGVVFGTDLLVSFVTNNSVVNDMPAYLYSENVNQSLLGEIIRRTGLDLAVNSPYSPLYIVIALGLTAITSLCIGLLRRDDADWMLVLCLTLGLLIYPKTLTHYNLMTAISIVLLIRYHRTPPFNRLSVFVVIVLVFACYSNNWFIEANVFMYLVVHGAAIVWIRKQPHGSAGGTETPIIADSQG